ncbi:MAG: Lrp/AsnC family transcriptional regulator [Nanoarchaeota archaeon]|nr:Lrp/AsnC family transcriptional regulator [Nanoarchaeota archaeon]
MKLDKQDTKILEVLQDDSRLTSREISELTGIRPSTVHSRIKRLKDKGVIEKFTVKTNNSMLGKEFIVYLLIAASKEIPNKVFADSRIEEVYGITGEYDLIIKCRFSGINEFNRFIIDLRKRPEIEKTLTMVGTIAIKE